MKSPDRLTESAVALAVFAGIAGVLGVVGLTLETLWLTALGVSTGIFLSGLAAGTLVIAERRRQQALAGELQAQSDFLESLVDSMAALAGLANEDEITEHAQAQARSLFQATSARILAAGETSEDETGIRNGTMVVPFTVFGEQDGALVLERAHPFSHADSVRATVLADFASRAVENSRLLGEAHDREVERTRLTEQVITAEQDERRRLSIFLHDGPLQQMAGIALMHDAALAAIADGRNDDAAKVVATSLEQEREIIRTLRDLTFAIEPLVLRDHGFSAAVRALGEQIEHSDRITVSISAEDGEAMSEKTQVALYQIIREALTQAVRRRPQLIDISVTRTDSGGFEATVSDDGHEERRRASIETIGERVSILNGRLAVETSSEGGTVVRVVIPAYVAAAPETTHR